MPDVPKTLGQLPRVPTLQDNSHKGGAGRGLYPDDHRDAITLLQKSASLWLRHTVKNIGAGLRELCGSQRVLQPREPRARYLLFSDIATRVVQPLQERGRFLTHDDRAIEPIAIDSDFSGRTPWVKQAEEPQLRRLCRQTLVPIGCKLPRKFRASLVFRVAKNLASRNQLRENARSRRRLAACSSKA